MKRSVSVIGGGEVDEETKNFAYNLGKELGKRGFTVINGGLGGIMEAVSKGVAEAGGMAVGIIPTYQKTDANKWITIPILTGLGHARNIIVAASGDVVVAIGGEYGTLSEISFALKLEKPVLGYKTWNIKGIKRVKNIEETIKHIENLIKTK